MLRGIKFEQTRSLRRTSEAEIRRSLPPSSWNGWIALGRQASTAAPKRMSALVDTAASGCYRTQFSAI